MAKKIFITGMPRSGKTTLLERVLNEIDKPKKGFITKEVRKEGERTGFELVGSNNKRATLASIDSTSKIRVSRYGVEVEAIQDFLPEFYSFEDEVLYIDEIGQMELYAEEFETFVERYLNATNLFIGTLSQVYQHPLIERIKRRDDIKIFELKEASRDKTYKEIIQYIQDH